MAAGEDSGALVSISVSMAECLHTERLCVPFVQEHLLY